jgi:DNA-3-methyladenine glycosylase
MVTAQCLTQAFFERPTLRVARDLIGKSLVRKIGRTRISAVITETEAYIGEQDLACHARFGRTARNSVMYGPAGIWYVYLIYGIHWMLNVVTEKECPAAVLIRAAVITGSGENLGGPGKLTKKLRIDDRLYGKSAIAGQLEIQDCGQTSASVITTPRIGIDYAGTYRSKRWRFVAKTIHRR